MISKDREFIFIHNFKTGGTSIENKLGHFDSLAVDVQDHRSLSEIQMLTQRGRYLKLSLYALKRGKPDRFAANLKLAASPELTAQEFARFYKFTFVRNTWDQVHSWYRNIMRDQRMRTKFAIPSEDYSFLEFLKHKMNHERFSQLNHIVNLDGKVTMDFIGRFTHLQEDFNTVCEHLSIEDTQLPELLVKKHDSYTKHYTPETINLVHKLYKEEIAYFKFEFGK